MRIVREIPVDFESEIITAVNHKGGRCVHPQGPTICQEGICSDCAVPKKSGELI